MAGSSHILEEVLRPGLDLVVCGTAASAESSRRGHYYAGPGNRFWSILADVGLTPRRLEPREYGRLPEFGIGLTDIVKDQAGGDAEIDFRGRGRLLEERILRYAPDWLCFNGKRAACEALGVRRLSYGPQDGRFGTARLYVAPSTSGAARRFWNPAHWHDLARRVRAP